MWNIQNMDRQASAYFCIFCVHTWQIFAFFCIFCIFHLTHSWFLAIPVPIQQALHQVSVNSSLTANFLYDRTCFGGGACRRRQGSQGEPAAGSLLSGRWPPARYWLPPAWLAATCAAACSLQRAALAAPTVGRPPPASGVASRRSSGWRPLVRLAAAGAAGMPAPAANCCRPPADGLATGRCSSAAAAGRGDPGASSTTGLAARSGLGDRCCGDLAACWSSMGRRRTARGGGRGGGTGGGRGDDGDGVADKDRSLSLSTSTSWRRSSSAAKFALCWRDLASQRCSRQESSLAFASPCVKCTNNGVSFGTPFEFQNLATWQLASYWTNPYQQVQARLN